MSETECPFCGSADGCDHLFGFIDRTFGTIDGGYLFDHARKVRDALIRRVRVLLDSPVPAPRGRKKAIYGFEKLFPIMKRPGPGTTENELRDALDHFVYLDFLDEVLQEIPGIEPRWGETDFGFPGSASCIRLYYTVDCPVALAAAIQRVSEWSFRP